MLLMWYYSCAGIICAAQLWHEQWYSNSAMPGAKHPQAAPCRVLDVLYSLHGKFNIKILKLKPLRMSIQCKVWNNAVFKFYRVYF